MSQWASIDELLKTIGGTATFLFTDEKLDVSSRGLSDDTPLHVAAVWGDVEAIQMLIAAGADVDAIGDMGCTPLHDAIGQGHVAAARCLIAAGAAIHIVNEFGQTAVEAAARKCMTGLFSGDGSEG